MSEITEISRRAWNATKMPTQPEFDGLAREFVLQLESRAEGVIATGLASEGQEVLACFEQAVKGIVDGSNEAAAAVEVPVEPEQNVMAMAAPIPEDVKEELVEEVVEEKVEPLKPKKPRKVQKREPQVPRKPKVIKAAAARGHATTTKKPALVAKKK